MALAPGRVEERHKVVEQLLEVRLRHRRLDPVVAHGVVSAAGRALATGAVPPVEGQVEPVVRH